MRALVPNLLALIILSISSQPNAYCAQGGDVPIKLVKLTANAYSLKKNKLLYIENHQLKYRGKSLVESVTKYLETDGKLIAVINSNYRSSQSLPEYSFKDYRLGFIEGLRKTDGQYVAFYQEDGEKEKSKILSETKDVFSGQAWNHFILTNLETIDAKGVKFRLLIPSRLDTYGFSLKKIKEEKGVIHLSLKFSNFFLRLLAPELLLFYDAKREYLTSYIGPSNLKDKDGDSPMVKIVYTQQK